MQPFEENDWSTNVDVLDEVVETDVHNLVVFNDEVNTFDHVIETLIDVCAHTPEQAEQCTLLIHYKGKCSVKNGSWEELVPMRNEICRRGISAEVLN
ncbi:ATP-dependent Clp protease adaptor ClpS [Spirosoma endophyticum]|uniref:ATP-dependent Clp protease adaptor protein ClpS n=1 Tax=Spirosoma endophyticum TaxID=662367 RepID=A0A1I1NEK3_9BACT|nr:ATP-dependent Clp protease adaptor ClpS [Spirosoma endophyticum]SFC92140.1 ATP-dependent Clp protease adaptor protein ClpS [Spirosoma endophyticum]